MLRASHVFAVILAMSAVAHAQGDKDKKRAQAVQLADDSERAYKAGQFEKAADLLRKAHGIYPEPILLYNLGRALEGMGDTRGAIDAYEQYLKEAKKIDDRPAIERRVATLKSQLEPTPPVDTPPPVDAGVTPTPVDHPPPDAAPLPHIEPPPEVVFDDDPGALHTYGPWATIGAGGLVVLTGALFGARAGANHDDAMTEPVQTKAADLQASARSDAAIANVLFAVGGVVMVGGAVWEYFEWKRDRPGHAATTGARLKVAPTGVAVEWLWR